MPSKRPRAFLYDSELPAPPPNPIQEQRQSDRQTRRAPGELTQKEMEFCLAMTGPANGNWTAAASMTYGYYGQEAWRAGRKMRVDPRINRQVQLLLADRLKRMRIDGDEHFGRLWAIANARPTEAVQMWVPPCRYCWGQNFEYQRTHAEFQEDFEAWLRLPDTRTRRQRPVMLMSFGETLVYDGEAGKLPFDQKGGDGYDSGASPNPECPNCFGRGLEVPGHGTLPFVKVTDTREMSLEGQLLFAGAKHTNRGIEVMLQDQAAARGAITSIFSKWLEVRAEGNAASAADRPGMSVQVGLQPRIADLLSGDPKAMSDGQLDAMLATYGVVIGYDEQSGEGEDSDADSGEAPPPGYVA